MNTQREDGDYCPENVIVTEIFQPVEYKNGSRSGQLQAFTIRIEQSYTNSEGALQERQSVDFWCTTFNPTVIQQLTQVTIGDKVTLVGWIEPSWRGYIADNTPDGDRFVMPDLGSEPITSPKGNTIPPSAHPYRAEKGVPNFIAYDIKHVIVTGMNTQREDGDYRPTGMTIVEILPPTQHSNGNGQVQQFRLHRDNNYTDSEGNFIEKQPLDIWCTTLNPEVIQTLATLTPGDKVDIIGWIKPFWQGYVADNTPDGDRFAIPDLGSEPITSPKGNTIHPSAHPYRAEKGVPNFITYDVKRVIVTELIPYTDNIDKPELGHDNIYWTQLSRWYRQEKNWICEGCSKNFENNKKYLDTHHVRGRAFNSPEYGDLKVLCVGCHALQKEPYDHSRMKDEERYKEFVRKFL